MKKAYWIIPLILIFLYIVIAAVRQALLVRNFSFKPSGYQINSLGAFETTITVYFDIENTMDIDINIKKIKIAVIINNTLITTITKENIKVPAHSMVTIDAIITFNPAELAYGSFPFLTNIKALPLEFKGYINIVTNYFYWNRLTINEATTLGEMLQK